MDNNFLFGERNVILLFHLALRFCKNINPFPTVSKTFCRHFLFLINFKSSSILPLVVPFFFFLTIELVHMKKYRRVRSFYCILLSKVFGGILFRISVSKIRFGRNTMRYDYVDYF